MRAARLLPNNPQGLQRMFVNATPVDISGISEDDHLLLNTDEITTLEREQRDTFIASTRHGQRYRVTAEDALRATRDQASFVPAEPGFYHLWMDGFELRGLPIVAWKIGVTGRAEPITIGTPPRGRHAVVADPVGNLIDFKRPDRPAECEETWEARRALSHGFSRGIFDPEATPQMPIDETRVIHSNDPNRAAIVEAECKVLFARAAELQG